MIPTVFPIVVLAVMDFPDLKGQLFEAPDQVADTLELDHQVVERLASVGSEGFDAILGSLIIHRLLPFPVGDTLLIAPKSFQQPISTERKVVRLDQVRDGAWIGPSGRSEIQDKSFGGGDHPTTRLCLEALETQIRPGDRVLDLGTGSGVVAIAAALLGAGSVDACDVDPVAVENAQANVAFNGLEERITVTQDDYESLSRRVGPAAYDVIVSNILGPVHLANLEAGMVGLLRPGGRLILSGFIHDFAPDLSRALEAHDLEVEAVHQSGRWACSIASRSQ